MEIIYMQQSSGYFIWGTEAESRHRGVIAVVWWRYKGWKHGWMTNYGLNILSFMLMTRWMWWYIVGAYILPNEHREVSRV